MSVTRQAFPMTDSNETTGTSRAEVIVKVLVGAGVLAILGTCAALVSPPGREFIGSTRRFLASVERATVAPGTAEIRAIGCDQALALPLREAAGFISSFSEEFATDETLSNAAGDTMWVQCRVELPAFEIPGCESVARAYGSAVAVDAPFIVVSGKPGTTICSGYYDADGVRLGALSQHDLSMAPD